MPSESLCFSDVGAAILGSTRHNLLLGITGMGGDRALL